MTEFIHNCYLWVVSNYKEITMILTSTQFISLVSALVLLVKSMKKTDDNTVVSKVLAKQLKKNDANIETVTAIKSELDQVKAENEKLRKDVATFKSEVTESLDITLTKINTMLEVQSVVYSTVKNDAIRETVNTLLVNAKYAETQTRAKLKKEVEDLKVKVAEKFDNVMEDVEKTVNVVSAVVADKKDESITRY